MLLPKQTGEFLSDSLLTVFVFKHIPLEWFHPHPFPSSNSEQEEDESGSSSDKAATVMEKVESALAAPPPKGITVNSIQTS